MAKYSDFFYLNYRSTFVHPQANLGYINSFRTKVAHYGPRVVIRYRQFDYKYTVIMTNNFYYNIKGISISPICFFGGGWEGQSRI